LILRALWRNNVQTVYFAGYLVGSIVMGILADYFGRRPIMLSSFIMIIIGSIGVAFGPQESFGTLASYIIYAISRFIIACGTRGINVTGFVLGMEIMGPSKRTFAGIVIEYFFAIGQLILVLIAYINNVLLENGWRSLAMFLILPCIPFLGYFL
jgi:OCT family organic cation transporter-like MFS transporter 4/5